MADDIARLLKDVEKLPDSLQEYMMRVAKFVNGAIETARRAEEKADAANRFIAAITESQSFEETMAQIESLVTQITGCKSAAFYRFDETSGKFSNSDGEYREWNTYQDIDELKGVMDSGEIYVKGDKALIPIISAQGEPVGVIAASDPAGFDKVDFSLFRQGGQITNNITLAIKKDIAVQRAFTDQLTGLKNRHAIGAYLETTVMNTLNKGNSVSVVMCDADHFKQINDTYGHSAGDMVLKRYAEILKAETRQGADCAFRWGGEEMVCILGCKPDKAIDIAERIRAQMEKEIFTAVGNDGETVEFKVTLSMGIAGMSPSAVVTKGNIADIFNSSLEKADNAVYTAKATGRNQVFAADKRDKISNLAAKVAQLIIGDEKSPDYGELKKFCEARLSLNRPEDILTEISRAAAEDSALYNAAEELKYELDCYCKPKALNIFSVTENSDTAYFMANEGTEIKDILEDVNRNRGADELSLSEKYKAIDKSEFDIISKLDAKFEINIDRDDGTVYGEAGRRVMDRGIRTFEAPLEEVRKIGRLAKDNAQAISDLWRVGNGRRAISDNIINHVKADVKTAGDKIKASPLMAKLTKISEWAGKVCAAVAEHKRQREAQQDIGHDDTDLRKK